MRVFLLCAGLILLGFPGCNQPEEGPELPPVTTMSMDLSLFSPQQEAALSLDGKEDDPIPDRSNFSNAAARVWWLNAAILKALSGPALVWAAAVSEDPSFDDGVWVWDFHRTLNGETFAAVLAGWFKNSLRTGPTLNVEMSVTCTGCRNPLDDYLWYEGSYDYEGTKGYWKFYNPEIAGDDQSFVRIDYTLDGEEHRVLTFVNIRVDGHEDAGDVIQYEVDGDLVDVTVHDESTSLDYAARWNRKTKEGWLEVPGYNNGQRACWDGLLINVQCPEG